MKKLFLLLALFGVLCSSCSDAGDEINNQQNPTEEPENGGDVQQCSEIWYTSTDGNIIELYKSEAFNVPILSNTYQDGMGVIRFDGEVTTIGNYAFANYDSLTSVTIPDSVTTIGEEAFYDCDSLTSITIGDSVTTIGEMAFWGCSSLTSVTIPDSVTEIGYQAFSGCTSLTSVTIPDSVTTMGDWVFNYCNSLTSVYCKALTPPTAVISYGSWNAFDDNASGRNIYVPIESVEAYKSASYWSNYADAIVGYNF